MSNQIHSTAIVDASVRLGQDNCIGPYAIVEAEVELGNANQIAAHAVLKRGTRMGNNNQVYEHAVIGGIPQDLKFTDPNLLTYVQIGDNNVLREYVSINRASKPGQATVLGHGNFLMATAHIGHDCQLGNNNTLVVSAGLAGHVSVADKVFISGGVMVHQFCHIGSYAMLGGNAKITQDCLPYMITDGNPAQVRGLNLVGLKRAGFSTQELRLLKDAYHLLFMREKDLDSSLTALAQLQQPLTDQLRGFIQRAKRSFHRPG
ncbi:MAG: acyl-ACP--UDP-N-acetylglucosamine O-acyltransferase [Gammaproteobacteria bacterium]|nr:acyl-ACP--UDP-N-acetylglucosamine O-acyltransferase [Gammaproteobacteria bacterium]